LAASLKQRFGVDAELVRGSSGVFDVRVDGKLVFSKHAVDRFPDAGEVEDAIARLHKA
jgi:selT/selW/selH-like putative selenoprotein